MLYPREGGALYTFSSTFEEVLLVRALLFTPPMSEDPHSKQPHEHYVAMSIVPGLTPTFSGELTLSVHVPAVTVSRSNRSQKNL